MSAPVALVPGVLALLPEYRSLVDPVAGLRAACLDAAAWLAEQGPVGVVADAQGARVAAYLLGAVADGGGGRGSAAGVSTDARRRGSSLLDHRHGALLDHRYGALLDQRGGPVLVVANGTARRSERAPGHLDERAAGYDEAVGAALRGSDLAALSGLDEELGGELLAGHVAGLRSLGRLLTAEHRAEVTYDDDPFGVQYWVVRWSCGS